MHSVAACGGHIGFGACQRSISSRWAHRLTCNLCCCAQAHGQKTAYAFMLDADFAVVDAWRLRNLAHRMVTECHERSIPECMKGVKVGLKCCSFIYLLFRTPKKFTVVQLSPECPESNIASCYTWLLCCAGIADRCTCTRMCAGGCQITCFPESDADAGLLVWQVWFKMGDMGFFSNRVFPTAGLGAPGGWLYKYPVHEVGSPMLTRHTPQLYHCHSLLQSGCTFLLCFGRMSCKSLVPD